MIPKIFYFLFVFALGAWSCADGLDPTKLPTVNSLPKLSGVINFKGGAAAWPPKDSVFDVRVVCFKNFPPTNIAVEVLGGSAFFNDRSLASFVDTANFSFAFESAPLEFRYIAVGQQWGSNVLTDWRVIGVYSKTGDATNPSALPLNYNDSLAISIDVDWSNLPPQPFVK